MIKIVTLLATILLYMVYAQPDGWKMIDRFYGFRFDMSTESNSFDKLESVQNAANTFGCFGWVQALKGNNIVGEARCAKNKGKEFHEWLKTFAGSKNFHSLVLFYKILNIILYYISPELFFTDLF